MERVLEEAKEIMHRVRYNNGKRPAWQLLLPRRAVFESDGTPIYEYSADSGVIRDLRSGEVLKPFTRLAGREYTLPDGSKVLLRSKFTGGYSVEKHGVKEALIERWPTPTRRQVGTERLRFDCAVENEEIFRNAAGVSLEEVIIAFHAFYVAQPVD